MEYCVVLILSKTQQMSQAFIICAYNIGGLFKILALNKKLENTITNVLT